jgi:hypothetical protein
MLGDGIAGRAALAAVAVALLAPAAAQAAGKPVVTTGAAANVAQQSVTLTGTVAPNGAPTTYYFQYGATVVYGSTTPATAVNAKTRVSAAISGLAPATTYHYRLVAQNAHGLTTGKDRAVKTRPQPLGVTLAATPNPVALRAPTTLAGTLSGTGNANRAVVLQANPFPYTQGFVNAANAQLTNAQGGFSFPLLTVPLNTQYRVLMTDRPAVVSPIVTVGVAVRVSTHVRRQRLRRGLRVRFSGTLRPARDGAQFAIQKLTKGTWHNIAGGITHHGGAGFSRYAKRARIRHSGTFRVFMGISDGNYVSNVGRTVNIRVPQHRPRR